MFTTCSRGKPESSSDFLTVVRHTPIFSGSLLFVNLLNLDQLNQVTALVIAFIQILK